jgi:calcineurin-like phosphoesterase family protein
MDWNHTFIDEYEMNEYQVEAWNKQVKPNDIVYHDGDFALCKYEHELRSIFRQLNGKIHIITGNHDHFTKEIRLRLNRLPFLSISDHPVLIDGMLFSHQPILNPKYPNIHGHLHERLDPNPMCLNVCVETLNYIPMPIEEAKAIFKKRGVC